MYLRPVFLSILGLAAISWVVAQDHYVHSRYSEAELDRLLAPIALYPDTLLTQVLIASTYPLEVVEAARWSKRHPMLSGYSATMASANHGWDPSVQALTAFPRILQQMDENLTWTRHLGEAFLLQEGDVMDSVQRLRFQAYHAGFLGRMNHLRTSRVGQVWVIEPIRRQYVMVPIYSTSVVYGKWRWPQFPPVCWASSVRPAGLGYQGGWHSPVVLHPSWYYACMDWQKRGVFIVWRAPGLVDRATPFPAPCRWQHNPRHRRGVPYQSPYLTKQFLSQPSMPGPVQRFSSRDFRQSGEESTHSRIDDSGWRRSPSSPARDSNARIRRFIDANSEPLEQWQGNPSSVQAPGDQMEQAARNRSARPSPGLQSTPANRANRETMVGDRGRVHGSEPASGSSRADRIRPFLAETTDTSTRQVGPVTEPRPAPVAVRPERERLPRSVAPQHENREVPQGAQQRVRPVRER